MTKANGNFLNGIYNDISRLVEDLENVHYLIADICEVSDTELDNERECILFASNRGEIHAKSQIICNYNHHAKETLNQLLECIDKYITEQPEEGR